MSRGPSIAVLIPVKDNLKGLTLSLRSLQDIEENISVVVVDDGSSPPIPPPESLQLSCPVHLIRLPVNCGVARALNAGLDYIRRHEFDYVARLDADDICHPQRFSQCLEVFQDRPLTKLVGTFATVERRTQSHTFRYAWKVPVARHVIARRMHLNTCFIHPTVIFPTSIIDEVGAYSEDFAHAEDFEFFFRIVRRFEAINVPSPLVTIMMHEQNISIRHYRRQLVSRIRIQWKYFDWMEPLSYLGLAKGLVLLSTPRPAIDLYKSLFGSK